MIDLHDMACALFGTTCVLSFGRFLSILLFNCTKSYAKLPRAFCMISDLMHNASSLIDVADLKSLTVTTRLLMYELFYTLLTLQAPTWALAAKSKIQTLSGCNISQLMESWRIQHCTSWIVAAYTSGNTNWYLLLAPNQPACFYFQLLPCPPWQQQLGETASTVVALLPQQWLQHSQAAYMPTLAKLLWPGTWSYLHIIVTLKCTHAFLCHNT